MSGLSRTVVSWVEQRIDDMLAAPPMWGSAEAIEMQVLQLLEMRALALRPQQELDHPRRVLDMYVAFLRERFPDVPPRPLFQIIPDAESEGFCKTLREFCTVLSRTILAENPFEHSQLAIRLTFDAGRKPTTSAFTGYYEEFRRATRASTRDRGSGRAKKDIEDATDFTLEDTIVTQPNGAPGEVLLRLGAGREESSAEAEAKVRDALSSIATIVEWAGSDEPITDLRLDDVESRTRTAVQALRLVPRRGVKTAAFGGRLLARSRPVEIRADHERRFVEVVGAEARVDAFDECDTVRAIDLDRGFFVLGKGRRLPCYAPPEILAGIGEVGVRARVIGRRYQSLWGKAFVLVEKVSIDSTGVGQDG